MTGEAPAVAVVTDDAAGPVELLDRAAAAIGFDERVRHAIGRDGSNGEVVIVPAMDGFAAGSPAMTDPLLVEHLVDRLYDLGAASVLVGSTEGTDALWAENRDVFLRADLLGYRYVTPAGRDYDIVDLADDAHDAPFPSDCALAGVPLSSRWQEAAFRIVFSACRTDTADGYALTLDTLLSVLPGRDKDSLYRRQRHPGAVARALLAVAPVDAALVDAIVSSHGHGGGARPLPLETHSLIAASDPWLADQAGALKMGLDPSVSRLWHAPLASGNPGASGSLRPFAGWINVSPQVRDAVLRRQKDAALDRSIKPLVQEVDTTLFPFRNEANARLNGWLQPYLLAGGGSANGTFALMEILLAQIAEARAAWRVMFAKDSIIRSSAALNVRAEDIGEESWSNVAPAIAAYHALLRGCPADSQGLRWRMVDGAVLFDCVRRFPVPFEAFAAAVAVNRTIQFMNDYIGGEAQAVATDRAGRVTRQLERNLYLPQPNFTALLGGDAIDVTKIETVAYAENRQIMWWQTLFSENGSALADDGLVEFAGVGGDTVVTIFARQQFRQPPLVEALNLELYPDIHGWLVTDAYRRFASRTFANLEAVLEGRDVRIGRAAAPIGEDEPLPVDRLVAVAERLRNELPDDWIETVRDRLTGGLSGFIDDKPKPIRVDADGFRHFRAASAKGSAETMPSGLLASLSRALAVDLERQP